jgi:hypothetical protein
VLVVQALKQAKNFEVRKISRRLNEAKAQEAARKAPTGMAAMYIESAAGSGDASTTTAAAAAAAAVGGAAVVTAGR